MFGSSKFGARVARATASGLITAGALFGCGSPTPGSSAGSDAVDASSSDAAGDDTTQVDAKAGDSTVDVGPPQVTEDFWVVYGRRYRQAGGDVTKNDLVLTSWKNPAALTNAGKFGVGVSPLDPAKGPIYLTESSLKKVNLTCAYGCFLSRDLRFIAVVTDKPGATGRTFQLGSVSPDLQVDVVKFGKIKDVAHLQFATTADGTFLFYSTRAQCNATGKCQYDIHRLGPLGDLDGSDDILTRMAPDADPDVEGNDTTYDGYFTVSDNASTVVFLTPTIRSLRVYAWRETIEGGKKTASVAELTYICANPVGDSCVGTGSQYSDHDGVAISPDGKTVVLFVIVDRWLRVRKFHLGSDSVPEVSDLVETPPGPAYLQAVCGAIKDKPWLLGEVKGQPQFSADGKTVYLLGYAECPKGGLQKKWTDILGIPVDKIGSKIGQGDWTNLTHNPRDESSKNRVINSFAFSPQRQVMILSATTYIGQAGSPLLDTDNRSKADTELYSLVVGDSKWTQITNDGAYATDSPQTVLPVAN